MDVTISKSQPLDAGEKTPDAFVMVLRRFCLAAKSRVALFSPSGLKQSWPARISKLLAYLLQSRNRLLLRRAIGCFAFPAHASVSSDHTPLITRTRYLPVIISYRPSFSLRSASGAPRRPGESVTTHLTHS